MFRHFCPAPRRVLRTTLGLRIATHGARGNGHFDWHWFSKCSLAMTYDFEVQFKDFLHFCFVAGRVLRTTLGLRIATRGPRQRLNFIPLELAIQNGQWQWPGHCQPLPTIANHCSRWPMAMAMSIGIGHSKWPLAMAISVGAGLSKWLMAMSVSIDTGHSKWPLAMAMSIGIGHSKWPLAMAISIGTGSQNAHWQ